MIGKSVFILGILSVLLMSFGFVSADVDDFDLDYSGNGSSSNPLEGNPNDQIGFSVFIDSNITHDINITWSVASGSGITSFPNYTEVSSNDSLTEIGFALTMPATDGSYYQLTADVVFANNDTLIGEETINIYYDVLIEGCTDSDATNYDSDATVDDGSCEYIGPAPGETVCEFEYNESENGSLEIIDFDITSTGDEEEWAPLDELTIEVEIENTDRDDDVRDVEVRIIVLDDSGNDVTDDFDFEDDIITSIGRLRDDEIESVTFELNVPVDIEYGSYRLYVVAYSDGNIDEQCVSLYDDRDFTDDLYYAFDVEEVEYEDSIIIDESELGVFMDVFCGQDNVEIVVPVYNLGEEDEEMVLVEIYNSELGIDEKKTIEDLRDKRDETLIFYVDIPEGLDREQYDLRIKSYFDWDDNEDERDILAYEEESTYYLSLDVAGCKGPAPTIEPSLQSEIKEGKELVVNVLVTNNGEDADFEILVSGYESWADLVSVTPQNAFIEEGEFIESTVVLMPKEDGRKSFTISTTMDGETYNQPISVNVRNTLGLDDLTGNNLYLGLTIAIFVVLVFIVLTLVARTSRRRPVKPQF